MIVQVTTESRFFLLILIISVMGFANAFWIVQGDSDRFTDNNLSLAFIYSYRTGIGDFETDDFQRRHEVLVWLIWLGSTFFNLIILLNMLIAIMGDTFGKIQETAESNTYRSLCEIMVENETLISRKRIFGRNKYIIIVTEEKAEAERKAWEGNFGQVRNHVSEMIKRDNDTLSKASRFLELFFSGQI